MKKHLELQNRRGTPATAFLRKAYVATSLALFGAVFAAEAGQGPQPSICSRACWGARNGTCTSSISTLSRAMIHHTAGPGDYTTSYETAKSRMRSTQNYHMDSNGWCDIGYHFLVSAGGHIFEGRKNSLSGMPRGAHDGCNANSFGFTALGFYHTPYNQTFTSALRNGLEAVIAWRMPSSWSATGSGTYCGTSVGTLDGHYKVKSTACPGSIIIGQIPSLRTGVMNRKNGTPPPPTFPSAKPGWYRNSDASWHLRTSLSGGASNITSIYGPAGAAGITPVMGDWDGDGTATVGWYRNSDASWHLSNSNSGGTTAYAFIFGVAGGSGIIPVTGDWNGNGKTSIGWYRVSDASWHLRNSLSAGASDYAFVCGVAGDPGITPVTGDWNGNGTTTVGWYRDSDASWHLRNSLSGGASDYTFVLGIAGGGVVPVTGDWNADGKTSCGWYRHSDASWHLRNALSGGASDITFVYGAAGALPVVWW